ncbi:MAG: hypothetical protein WD749_04030 [Phycisphaerales bacterium]
MSRAAASPARPRHAALGVAAAFCLLLLGGCREFEAHRDRLSEVVGSGRFDIAAAMLDDPATRERYGARNDLLWKLDRGAVALAMDDPDTAIALLNDAEAQVELERKNAGDTASQWLLNDTAAKYIAAPYEDLYINALKLLAQLQAGRVQGGATVEARRAAGKADLLRDLYTKQSSAAEAQARSRGASVSGPRGMPVEEAGEFVESPLTTFLSAVTFMKSGEREYQRVAGKRLIDSIRIQRGLIGPVREEDFAGLDELDPASVNVLVVGLSGRGPTKFAQRIGPIPIGTLPVYFELPYLRTYRSEVAGVRVEVESGTSGAAQTLDRLKLVEDLSSVATVNHNRTLPLIYQRTLVRYMLKAGASIALTEMGRRSARDRDQGLIQLAGVLAGLAYLGATEQADLRCWIFLPGQARVGLLKLPPGEHRIRTVFEGAGGGAVYASPWRTVRVTENGLSTVVTQYWR